VKQLVQPDPGMKITMKQPSKILALIDYTNVITD